MSIFEKPYELRIPIPHQEKVVRVLGIESTSHTFGVGVLEMRGNKVYFLSNALSQYKPTRGGIHPRESFIHHANVAPRVVSKALDESNLNIKEIDVIAVSTGPGLGPCLRVGSSIARFLASYFNKPVAPVNHAVAHIEIGKLVGGLHDPVIIYVSGGNTMILVQGNNKYRVLGETLDIPLGNLFDTFAREVGIAPPYVVDGNHAVDICAEWSEEFVPLPYTIKGCDLSFSGLLTAALRLTREHPNDKRHLGKVCRSLRETAFNMLIEVAERTLMLTNKNSFLLVGGVAANKVLREKMISVAKQYGVEYYGTPPEVAGDNGLMIAYTGLLHYLYGKVAGPESIFVRQRYRLDEEIYPWLP